MDESRIMQKYYAKKSILDWWFSVQKVSKPRNHHLPYSFFLGLSEMNLSRETLFRPRNRGHHLGKIYIGNQNLTCFERMSATEAQEYH